ncbi:uncharacterized protein BO96DRAFT_437864 [Aspergillus niger CBS 101883]|uniref:Uncharacterized protein n=2 Tax=Aspergillus niger TaxID=5061 RepID=A2QLI2_ASPNC|nr:uncharacterized protein BO96DRAFT_437864 [Aspergillus niger CBS 101883]XP_059600806.1 hypothetical protein An06g01330 [Aspergillus niger]PYH52515.1 hypothetical protein BO96DRAFT_437864 [Aspergillus niger CBS 101883]CAK39201.1 hypothetical protein An06g01330 [Aspergillus niger]
MVNWLDTVAADISEDYMGLSVYLFESGAGDMAGISVCDSYLDIFVYVYTKYSDQAT